MARRMTVLQFASEIGAGSDEIPVTIRRGAEVIGRARSLYRLPATGSVGVLESKISFVTIKRDEVVIQVK